MTGDERIALLLAARLLESDIVLEPLALGEQGGHVNVALTLTDRLRRVTSGPDQARAIIDSLPAAEEAGATTARRRGAAEEPVEA